MNDEYLWSKDGEPDPDVKRLEEMLGELRYSRQAPELPARRPRILPGILALAAGLAIVIGLSWPDRRRPEASEPGWEVTALAGAPLVAGDAIATTGSLGIGDWLVTDADSRARLQVADIGRVDVASNSRLRLKTTGEDEHRIELARGRIEALVTAPPRLFIVDTAAATAVDLGCMYTLEVGDDGAGELAVELGWVALEEGDLVAYVPRGARCAIRPGHGPGIPRFDECAPELVRVLDAADDDPGVDLTDLLAAALPAAVERDTLSLWHLLQRVPPAGRPAVHDRMAELTAPPAGVTRAAAIALDPAALEAWKETLEPLWW